MGVWQMEVQVSSFSHSAGQRHYVRTLVVQLGTFSLKCPLALAPVLLSLHGQQTPRRFWGDVCCVCLLVSCGGVQP